MNLKTEYKHIYFRRLNYSSAPKRKTSIWGCYSLKNDFCLGLVEWQFSWRQYCYYPEIHTLYSKDCLQDIQDFMQKLRAFELAERKKKND